MEESKATEVIFLSYPDSLADGQRLDPVSNPRIAGQRQGNQVNIDFLEVDYYVHHRFLVWSRGLLCVWNSKGCWCDIAGTHGNSEIGQ
jgi:hypothetical protein